MIYQILSLSALQEDEWETARQKTALVDTALGRSYSRSPIDAQREHQAAWWLALNLLEKTQNSPVSPAEFCVGEHGKPALKNGTVSFNISHTAGYALCAVHPTAVGADIQKIKSVKPQLVERVCTPEERVYVGEDPARFAEVFSAKEAYVKYLGIGLSAGLSSVTVATKTGLLPTVNRCRLLPLTGEDYRAAIVFKD